MRARRWTLALTASIAAFVLVWWAWVHYELPPTSDRLSVALAVAAMASAVVLAPMAWWASRELSRTDEGPARGGNVTTYGQDAAASSNSVVVGPGAHVGAIHYATQGAAAPEPEPTAPIRPLIVGRIPRQPVGFQRREPAVAELKRALDSAAGGVAALVGTRGVGKTQLAAAYARARHDAGWRLVAWIAAEDKERLLFGLAELGESIGCKVKGLSPEKAAHAALAHLTSAPEPALIVYDNAKDPELVADWLPHSATVKVILTTTEHTFYGIAAQVPVDVFSDDEAVAYLEERTGNRDAAAARNLASELGRLPLALAQAAWVIRSQRLSYAIYTDRLQSASLDSLLIPVPGHGYPRGVAEALLLAIDAAEAGDQQDAVRAALESLAMLSPDDVPRKLLYAVLDSNVAQGATAEIDNVIGALSNSSLVTLSAEGDQLRMHRLVQAVIRARALQEGRLLTRAVTLTDGLSAYYRSHVGPKSDYRAAQAWYEQVRALRGALKRVSTTALSAGEVQAEVPSELQGARAEIRALEKLRSIYERVSIFQDHALRHLAVERASISRQLRSIGVEDALSSEATVRVELQRLIEMISGDLSQAEAYLGSAHLDVDDLRSDIERLQVEVDKLDRSAAD